MAHVTDFVYSRRHKSLYRIKKVLNVNLPLASNPHNNHNFKNNNGNNNNNNSNNNIIIIITMIIITRPQGRKGN